MNDDIKLALVTSTYVPNIDTHKFFSSVTNEVVGAGYTADGQSLVGNAVTQDDTNDEGKFDANDVVWAASTITARAGVLYKDTGVAATSPLICYFDFGSDITSTVGNFTVAWATTGILTLA